MKPIITAIITFLLPSFVATRVLNLLGHHISTKAYIGFSWIQCTHLKMNANSRIGNFNLIRINDVCLNSEASIRSFNRLKGPFNLLMDKRAAIGNSNSIYRSPWPITSGDSEFRLGELTIVTSKHQFDCTKPIQIGDFSTISGFGTQFWTHGFYHADKGPSRIRIDGPIKIGCNVSIGSKCLINPGVNIGNAINVGGNSCISKSILQQGMYVSQGLRYIPNSLDTLKNKLNRNTENKYVEVYEK